MILDRFRLDEWVALVTGARAPGAAVFLSSPASDYMHGHLLVVDGGWMGR